MPSTSPFGMSPASMRATSLDTTSFNLQSLLESLSNPDAAVNKKAESGLGVQWPQPSSTPVDEKSAGNCSANSGVAGAKDCDDQLDAAEQRLWCEVKETIATFG